MTDLHKLKESSYSQEPVNPLFKILRSNFDRLSKWEQELFMDVALFSPSNIGHFKLDMMEWLCLVHNKEKEVIENWLRHLVDSALLEYAEMSSRKISIHDLYREFAGLEAQEKLNALDMEERRWVYPRDALPTELVDEPRSSWKKLTRVYILETNKIIEKLRVMSLVRTIEWKCCTNLVVLELNVVYALSEVLNFKDLIRLRSLTVKTSPASMLSIEGLEGLKSLTYFKMVRGAYVGQLPAALKVLEVDGVVVFERDVLALCTNLVSLKLWNVKTTAKDLDLRSCTSLQKVELIHIEGLEIVRLGPNLQSLDISWCQELVEVCGSDRLVGLLSLVLTYNRKLSKLPSLTGLKRLHTLNCDGSGIDEVPGLDGLVGLQSLSLSGCRRLLKLPSDLTGLQCLRKLEIFGLGGITEIPNLSGLEQLLVIKASWNSQLTSLQGLRDLRALTTLHLSHCQLLCRLSDMSKLTNIKALDLRYTGVKFYEKDIHMLEGLQALEPVLAADNNGLNNYGLDFKRHKIMYHPLMEFYFSYQGWQTWNRWSWEEKDLHYPSVAGYLVGKGFGIQDVGAIWELIPGPTTKFNGVLRHLVWP